MAYDIKTKRREKMEELTVEEKKLYDLKGSVFQFKNAGEFVNSMIDLCKNYLIEDEVKRNFKRTENSFSVKAEGYLDGGYYVTIRNHWSDIFMDFKVLIKNDENNTLELELDYFDMWILSENQDSREIEEKLLAEIELCESEELEETEEERTERVKQKELLKYWWKYGRVNEYFYSCTIKLSND